MDQTIYAYWNGRQLYDILNAVVLVTGGSEGDAYRQLMTSIALLAFLVSAGVGLAKLRATDTATAFMALTFFYGIFFIPTTTVHIDDVRKNQNYTVANVPLGLALFGGMTSSIGYWLTNAYETSFTSVDDEKFSRYGFLFGSRLIDELPRQYYKNSIVRDNVKNFIINCVNPELDANPGLVNAMVSAKDMWSFFLGNTTPSMKVNPGRVTTIYDQWSSTSKIVPCIGTNEWDYTGALGIVNLDTIIGTFSEINLLGKKLHPGDENSFFMWTEISDWETTMTGVSRSAIETIRHYALINMARETNEDRAGVFAATVAASQLETSYQVMRILAEGALPKIRNLIEATIYAVFPIVFLIVIGAGAAGGKVLVTYGMTAVWVQLWAPLYAVINSFMFKASSEAMLELTNSLGGTMTTIPHMLSMSASDQAIAGLMTISVPAIALALVKGGTVAMSGVVNSLMSPSQSTSSKAGGEIGAGNVSGGMVNWGATRIGGSDVRRDSSYTAAGSTIKTPEGTFSYGSGGNLTGVSPNEFGTSGASVKAERQDGGRTTDASSLGVRGAHGKFAEAGNVKQAGYSAQSTAEFGRKLDTALATRLGAEFRNNATDATASHVGGDNRRGSGTSLSTDEAARIASYLGIGGSGRDESSVGAEGRSGSSYTQPGGGSNGRGGMPGGNGTGGNGNLPARSGSVGPDVTHNNSLSRGRKVAGALLGSADIRGGTEASQRLSDVAKNENGQFTRREQQWAAQTLAAAVNDVTRNTNDQGIRAAGQKFMADNGFSARSTTGERASSENYMDSGQRIERFGGGTTGGSLQSQKPVWDAAMSMVQSEGYSGVGAHMEANRRLRTDEGFRAQATANAAQNEGHTANPVTGLSDMPEPRSQGSVEAAADRGVGAVATTGGQYVADASARANSNVAAKQPFSPTSMPDTTRAESEYGRVQTAAQARQAQQAEQASFAAGSNNLAAQLYQSNAQGMSMVASIAYLGGMGYDSPSGYSAALEKASREDPGLRAEIAQYASGKEASEADLERIFGQVADKLK